MGRPSLLQIAEAIIFSARSDESDAEFDARYAGLSRMSDEEIAAMGIHPPTGPAMTLAEPVEEPVLSHVEGAETHETHDPPNRTTWGEFR